MSLEHFEKNNSPLKWITKGIILFWAIWSFLVALSDSVNLLQHSNLLPSYWLFTSGNYELVVQVLSQYKINSQSLILFLYFIIVVFAWIITFYFARAAFTSQKNLERYLQRCYTAFFMLLAIDAFFILIDELFIQYTLEHGHMDRLGFKLVTFLVFFVLEKQHHDSLIR